MQDVAQPQTTERSASHAIADLFDALPRTLQALLVISTVFLAGWTAQIVIGRQFGLGARLSVVEKAQAKTDSLDLPKRITAIEQAMPALRYLTCTQLEQRAHRDGGGCQYFIRNNMAQFAPLVDSAALVRQ